ncbi:protein RALF-like 19 [Cajanus cajan]|uniref:Protein RALF-like 19 n=1 Tax=Cajanus cajan TaxID=3821 RepID=A0A151T782_CAJCA|nr:protein RALF-like 19 [Cajanus cajan]XP_020220236.1 protein RALF-like 19 [Cajanus cajan]KYP62903.1 hypothetical protein KK1_017463 [Cajanus cajan]KYP62906.1 hypothetical protein KK1_017466 [Cajanus cajan]
MSSKGWFVFLLLALAMVAEAYTTLEELSPTVSDDDMDLIVDDNEFLMSSESQRRILMQGQRNRYISYGALRANNIPCGWHGRSYYDCSKRDRASPYTRGCSAITHCARDTSS